MSKIYEAWAIELIDELHQEWVDPFSPENYKAAIEKLAKNLEEDVTDWLVPEEFCADCDYQRRCNQ